MKSNFLTLKNKLYQGSKIERLIEETSCRLNFSSKTAKKFIYGLNSPASEKNCHDLMRFISLVMIT